MNLIFILFAGVFVYFCLFVRGGKKYLALSLVGSLLVFAFSLFDSGRPVDGDSTIIRGEHRTLQFLAQERMIPREIYQQLEEDTGIEVVETTFKDNKHLEEIILSGANFDVALVPDYWAHRLKRLGHTVDVNYKKVPNAKMISPKISEYDPLRPLLDCSVPYLFGTLSIGYNRFHFGNLPLSWGAFFDKDLLKQMKGRVALNGEMRNMLSILLKTQGKCPNSTDPDEVKAAGEYMKQIMSDSLPFISASNNDELLADETVYIGAARSSDMTHAMETNLRMRFANADEGAVFFLECLSIMKNCTDKGAAHEFINYLYHPEVAAKVTNMTFRASLNDAAKPYVRPEILNGPSYFFPNDDEVILLKDLLKDEEEIYQKVCDDVMSYYKDVIVPMRNEELVLEFD